VFRGKRLPCLVGVPSLSSLCAAGCRSRAAEADNPRVRFDIVGILTHNTKRDIAVIWYVAVNCHADRREGAIRLRWSRAEPSPAQAGNMGHSRCCAATMRKAAGGWCASVACTRMWTHYRILQPACEGRTRVHERALRSRERQPEVGPPEAHVLCPVVPAVRVRPAERHHLRRRPPQDVIAETLFSPYQRTVSFKKF